MAPQSAPIYSTRDDEYEAQEEISDFVIALAERVDLLQDAESIGELDQLAGLAEKLGEEAEKLGFPSLADVSQRLARACHEDLAESAQKALIELTELSQRVRLGHRGAA